MGCLKEILDENLEELKKRSSLTLNEIEVEFSNNDIMFYLDSEDNISKFINIIKSEFNISIY